MTSVESGEDQAAGISAIEIIKMNAPEWPLILTASITSVIAGVIQPSFALLMSQIIGVSCPLHYGPAASNFLFTDLLM